MCENYFKWLNIENGENFEKKKKWNTMNMMWERLIAQYIIYYMVEFENLYLKLLRKDIVFDFFFFLIFFLRAYQYVYELLIIRCNLHWDRTLEKEKFFHWSYFEYEL